MRPAPFARSSRSKDTTTHSERCKLQGAQARAPVPQPKSGLLEHGPAVQGFEWLGEQGSAPVPRQAGENLIRNNLENNCIVQLRILLRKRCGHFNFQAMHHHGPHPCLALQQLGNGLQRDPVQPKRICRIGNGKRGQQGSGRRFVPAWISCRTASKQQSVQAISTWIIGGLGAAGE